MYCLTKSIRHLWFIVPTIKLLRRCTDLFWLWGWREKYLCFWPTGRVIFFKSRLPGKQILGKKRFFLSSLQTSLGLPVTSFLKKWAIYNKTITLNLEHTFFLRETYLQRRLLIIFLCRTPSTKPYWNSKYSWLKRLSTFSLHKELHDFSFTRLILTISLLMKYSIK